MLTMKRAEVLAQPLPLALTAGHNDLMMCGQLICPFLINAYGCIIYSSMTTGWPKITFGTGPSFVLYIQFLSSSLSTMGSLIPLKFWEGWTLLTKGHWVPAWTLMNPLSESRLCLWG